MLKSRCTYSSSVCGSDKMSTDRINQDALVGQSFIAKKTEAIQTCDKKGKRPFMVRNSSLTNETHSAIIHSLVVPNLYDFLPFFFSFMHMCERFKSYSRSKTNSE